MLAGEATGVGFFPSCAEEDFGGKDVFVARPIQFFERITHLNLRLSVGIDFSCVEEVDAMVPCSFKTILSQIS